METYFKSDCTFQSNETDKAVKREAIMMSTFYSEVEQMSNLFYQPYASFDIDITAIRKTKILGIALGAEVNIEPFEEMSDYSVLTTEHEKGGWWQVVVAFITEASNGKEKVTKEIWMAPGANMREANKYVKDTFYQGVTYDFNFVDTKLTKVTEVIIKDELIKEYKETEDE